MPKLMNRAAILAANDIQTTDIDLSDIPGWGTVRIKDLTASERDQLEAGMTVEVRDKKGRVKREVAFDNVRAAFCAAALVGDDGALLFSRSDIEELGKKSARALDRIFAQIRARNGLSDNDIEELVGNFTPGQSADMPTA